MRRNERSEIIVRGIAKEYTLPDMGIVIANIVSTGEDPVETEMLNSDTVDKILKWLKRTGVQDKDIRVEKEILTPFFDYENNILKHQATTFIAVYFYDYSSMSEFVYNIEQEKDIIINRIVITLSNVYEFYNMALKNAVLTAYDKANIIAESMNTRLIPTPLVLEETTNFDEIIDEIIITGQQLKDIEYPMLVIPASVEVKFLVEEIE